MSTNNTVYIATFKKDTDGVSEDYTLEVYGREEIMLVAKDGDIRISAPLYKQKVKDVFIRMLPSLQAQGYTLYTSIF